MKEPQKFFSRLAASPLALVVFLIIGLLWAAVAGAAIYLPIALRSAAIDAAFRSNIEVADQIKITRGYYTKYVVAKALGSAGALVPSYNHKQDPKGIPLPATFVHDISELLEKRDTTLSLVSPYPWPHRASRTLDDFESNAWKAFLSDPSAVFSREEVRNDKRVLRVAVADRMSGPTCVSCHNNHPESTKRDWKVGDVRAVMEVTRVIEPFLITAEERSGTIVLTLAGLALAVTVILVVILRLVDKRTLEKQEATGSVRYLAEHDALTGLFNRANFVSRLNSISRVRAATRERTAVHHIDLDSFDAINKRFGHATGDELVRHVAMRLREITGDIHLLARFGGDEFAVAQLNVRSENDAVKLARQVLAALSAPFELGQHRVEISASIGVAESTNAHEKADVLLQAADIALYRAKKEGRNRYVIFTPTMASELNERQELEKAITLAAKHEGFQLHYQPICGSKTRDVEGFEALLRLPKPDGGFISPAVFIPVAEHMGLISQIGFWVLKRACQVAATWPEPLTISVNLSPAQFHVDAMHGRKISDLVRDALVLSQLSPSRLELEITESLLLETTNEVTVELERLKSLGVALVMDDFDTGYSSLNYLWKLPLDKVKIDRSFVAAATNLPGTINPILETIVGMSRTLRLKVTAEGVETEEQAALMTSLACDQMQGYYFGRPMPESDVAVSLLKSQGKSALFQMRHDDQHETALSRVRN